jgi:hypothetical protein
MWFHMMLGNDVESVLCAYTEHVVEMCSGWMNLAAVGSKNDQYGGYSEKSTRGFFKWK